VENCLGRGAYREETKGMSEERSDRRQVSFSEVALARQRLNDAIWAHASDRIRHCARDLMEACMHYAETLERR